MPHDASGRYYSAVQQAGESTRGTGFTVGGITGGIPALLEAHAAHRPWYEQLLSYITPLALARPIGIPFQMAAEEMRRIRPSTAAEPATPLLTTAMQTLLPEVYGEPRTSMPTEAYRMATGWEPGMPQPPAWRKFGVGWTAAGLEQAAEMLLLGQVKLGKIGGARAALAGMERSIPEAIGNVVGREEPTLASSIAKELGGRIAKGHPDFNLETLWHNPANTEFAPTIARIGESFGLETAKAQALAMQVTAGIRQEIAPALRVGETRISALKRPFFRQPLEELALPSIYDKMESNGRVIANAARAEAVTAASREAVGAMPLGTARLAEEIGQSMRVGITKEAAELGAAIRTGEARLVEIERMARPIVPEEVVAMPVPKSTYLRGGALAPTPGPLGEVPVAPAERLQLIAEELANRGRAPAQAAAPRTLTPAEVAAIPPWGRDALFLNSAPARAVLSETELRLAEGGEHSFRFYEHTTLEPTIEVQQAYQNLAEEVRGRIVPLAEVPTPAPIPAETTPPPPPAVAPLPPGEALYEAKQWGIQREIVQGVVDKALAEGKLTPEEHAAALKSTEYMKFVQGESKAGRAETVEPGPITIGGRTIPGGLPEAERTEAIGIATNLEGLRQRQAAIETLVASPEWARLGQVAPEAIQEAIANSYTATTLQGSALGAAKKSLLDLINPFRYFDPDQQDYIRTQHLRPAFAQMNRLTALINRVITPLPPKAQSIVGMLSSVGEEQVLLTDLELWGGAILPAGTKLPGLTFPQKVQVAMAMITGKEDYKLGDLPKLERNVSKGMEDLQKIYKVVYDGDGKTFLGYKRLWDELEAMKGEEKTMGYRKGYTPQQQMIANLPELKSAFLDQFGDEEGARLYGIFEPAATAVRTAENQWMKMQLAIMQHLGLLNTPTGYAINVEGALPNLTRAGMKEIAAQMAFPDPITQAQQYQAGLTSVTVRHAIYDFVRKYYRPEAQWQEEAGAERLARVKSQGWEPLKLGGTVAKGLEEYPIPPKVQAIMNNLYLGELIKGAPAPTRIMRQFLRPLQQLVLSTMSFLRANFMEQPFILLAAELLPDHPVIASKALLYGVNTLAKAVVQDFGFIEPRTLADKLRLVSARAVQGAVGSLCKDEKLADQLLDEFVRYRVTSGGIGPSRRREFAGLTKRLLQGKDAQWLKERMGIVGETPEFMQQAVELTTSLFFGADDIGRATVYTARRIMGDSPQVARAWVERVAVEYGPENSSALDNFVQSFWWFYKWDRQRAVQIPKLMAKRPLLAAWGVDHLMNRRYSKDYDEEYHWLADHGLAPWLRFSPDYRLGSFNQWPFAQVEGMSPDPKGVLTAVDGYYLPFYRSREPWTEFGSNFVSYLVDPAGNFIERFPPPFSFLLALGARGRGFTMEMSTRQQLLGTIPGVSAYNRVIERRPAGQRLEAIPLIGSIARATGRYAESEQIALAGMTPKRYQAPEWMTTARPTAAQMKKRWQVARETGVPVNQLVMRYETEKMELFRKLEVLRAQGLIYYTEGTNKMLSRMSGPDIATYLEKTRDKKTMIFDRREVVAALKRKVVGELKKKGVEGYRIPPLINEQRLIELQRKVEALTTNSSDTLAR